MGVNGCRMSVAGCRLPVVGTRAAGRGVRWRDPDSAQRIRSRYDAFVITVIFACVHNAGRSQMAAAIFNAFADPEIARAVSAGTHPAERVHPEVVQVMHEVGVDLSGATPRGLSDGITREANWLITMGCGEQCPVVPGALREVKDDYRDSFLRIRCPRCQWEPGKRDRWRCDPGGCGHDWNTFETHGRCPSCEKQWSETACFRCSAWSPHDDWYEKAHGS